MEKNSRTEMLPGKRDFDLCCRERGVAPHTCKQRVLAAISKLRSAFFTGYKNKICTYYIYTRKMVPITGRASASFSSMLKLKRIGNE